MPTGVPNSCVICRSPNRLAIDREIVMGEKSMKQLAKEIGVARRTVYVHRAHCSKALQAASEHRDQAVAGTLLGEMRAVQARAWDLLNTMQAEGDHRGAVLALREAREVVEGMDGMLTRATELLASHGQAIVVVDAGQDGFCPECLHCREKLIEKEPEDAAKALLSRAPRAPVVGPPGQMERALVRRKRTEANA